jgi:Centromere DNA-binding protein complex CBF3 subunit, domain 2
MVVPPQPTQADFDQTVTNALQGLNDYAGPERIDRTYDKIIDHYCAWVDLQLANNAAPPLTGGMYTTPGVVELYFAKVVGYRADVQPNTAKRTMYGLQKLADRERIGQAERWELKSSKRIQEALDAQKRLYETRQSGINIDPHHNLPTNTLSATDWGNCICHVLEDGDNCNWQAFTLCFNGSEQMMCRFASMKKFRLCELNTIDTHGPRHDGPFDREMLSLVYRKGSVHKENQSYTRVVGAWRHITYYKCFTGSVAMSLFVRLYNGELDFRTFGDPDPMDDDEDSERPPWWNLLLVEGWGDSSAARSAYSKVFEALGIRWSKCVHLRTASIEHASAVGELSPEIIATMTKHGASRDGMANLLKHYMTELHPELLRVTAGFDKDDRAYRVWRTQFDVDQWVRQVTAPGDDREVVDVVFPHYRRWKEQQESEWGDKSEAAENFIKKTLPFLAKVVLQDGVYWIHDFPDHPVSRLLTFITANRNIRAGRRPHPYVQFGNRCREWAQQQQEHLPEDQLQQLHSATRNTVHVLANQVATLDGKLVTVDHKMETLLAYEARRRQWEEEKERREERREAERLCQQRSFYASMCQQVIAHVAAAPGRHHHQLPRTTIPPAPPPPPPCDPRPPPSRRSERARSPSARARDVARDAAQQQLRPPPSSLPPPPPPPACEQRPIPPIPNELPYTLHGLLNEHYTAWFVE